MCSEVRNKFDIYELYSELIGGALSGSASSDMRQARCPYPDHEDRTPSFTLYSDTQKFFCFGCDRTGDAVNLAHDLVYPGVSMRDAAERLLNRVGSHSGAIGVSPRKPVVREKAVVAVDFEAVREAQAHYAAVLFSDAGEAGMEYLRVRGISRKTARLLGLGFGGGGALESVLSNAGISRRRAIGSGLLNKKGQERFADRLILPEADNRGRFIWMIGRAITDDAQRFQALPGSRSFYGAGALTNGLARLVVVEGVFDYLLLRSWGYDAFGLGGGVLAERAALAIEALDPLMVAVVLDNDAEGRKLSAALCERLGSRAFEIFLPDGVKDVSDLAGYADGRLVFRRLLDKAG